MEQQAIIAIGVFLVTYALIISEKIHRTIVAMLGGALMVILGIVDQETAIHHIDFNTLGLLTGMMIIVAITAQTGLFKFIAIWSAKKVNGEPVKILIALSMITAIGSAFLDNVTTVLLMVPVTFSITRQLRISALPFLISEILTANIGGTATMIGDPPNIMIGSAVKELTFVAFINNLTLISIVILIITVAILALLYRKQIQTTEELKAGLMDLNEKDEITDTTLLKKCLIILVLTIGGFFIHQIVHVESATVALLGAFVLLLLTGEHYLEDALPKVEWTTIFFFVGLFILVSGLVETGVIAQLATKAIELTEGNLVATSLLILWMSAIASAFVDNIPFVATMIPMIQEMGKIGISDLEPLWWSLALGACLGGNGTLIGASANLIVAGMAAKEGYNISFLKFLWIGFPLMILSIIISTVYIYLRYLI
ncbi:ArsB/NhaD family transporter [Aneurinibacillus aneurinilyticus]|jgi:Na+/H+ antiporter NhaD/arsenite permease-like protein|uniref:ArsB/NhaD family transporter n=2 Tax=Aneurinibacillus aneurinilyticus TaxID=1391 RepID=A0A848CVV1_ANEAE|nr:ArsB/NhaD family transporter [Aneurinibacillus aneurinilyticus]ERI09773.1 citrate transporter [Aneurinibacillus aneurinilyticus ATCC 12856]MCI1694955.1 ArsB/NhaD family transporter [Aneurinibacillus aneurinilyticus]MED0707128.1 ArsB/NhaD family transporter [Aneurinibacillus aneurinilyticus]MED0723484.1 ArsB/NhaD family transporter [Aneurinibacillus aneurinilyticus]MED0732803.1 ArsB/NhaD family transporter [Aneurinibacillus aneurinilyticus]